MLRSLIKKQRLSRREAPATALRTHYARCKPAGTVGLAAALLPPFGIGGSLRLKIAQEAVEGELVVGYGAPPRC